jgi:hypothetical protein
MVSRGVGVSIHVLGISIFIGILNYMPRNQFKIFPRQQMVRK